MPLAPGYTLAQYRITAALGAGGMGEVYRATDTKLAREVAIKVLPAELAQDAERLARFEREAKLLASLNHPNIAHVYGFESATLADGSSVHLLAMELVPGEDLAERQRRGAIPVDDAIAIAKQIAEALEEAHEHGIVHRDLKPANVKVTPDGKVKVLDFGLAKAWEGPGAASSDLSQSPTLAHTGTAAGLILGTAAYMSPEQARGRAVDKRADIWAFGVVLFEMLTGRRLFAGETVSDILASVLKEEPPWGELPPGLPLPLQRVLRRCLRKQPRDRFHDIADVRLELSEAPESEGRASETTPGSSWRGRILPWTLAFAAAAVAAWLGLRASNGQPSAQTVVASILPPPGAEFLVERGLALSPDGRELVFAARDDQGGSDLWLRRLDDPAARKLAGTQEGRAPFWSPDGRHVGFMASGKLKRIQLETGLVENLAELPGEGVSGAWSPSGEIVFSSWGNELKRVAAGGGVPTALFPARNEVERVWPTFLPDGKRFLFLQRDYADTSRLRQLRLGSLDAGLDQEVMSLNSNALYAPSGHLVWWQDGNLRAQRVDPQRLAVSGQSRVIAPGVQFNPSTGMGAFGLSGTTLVYLEGGLLLGDELVRVSRSGEELGPVAPPGNYYRPRLSPDGARVAVDRSDETNRGDIWVYEIERGTGTRLSAAPEDESCPEWSPDGSRIAYWAALDERNLIRVRASGDAGPDEEFARWFPCPAVRLVGRGRALPGPGRRHLGRDARGPVLHAVRPDSLHGGERQGVDRRPSRGVRLGRDRAAGGLRPDVPRLRKALARLDRRRQHPGLEARRGRDLLRRRRRADHGGDDQPVVRRPSLRPSPATLPRRAEEGRSTPVRHAGRRDLRGEPDPALGLAEPVDARPQRQLRGARVPPGVNGARGWMTWNP